MKRMLFIYNPKSGKGTINVYLSEILQQLSAADYEITVYPTKKSRDGYEKVISSEGMYDVIACSGGDGTLNEVVSAIMTYTKKKPFIGYIPSGTTNDFARSLNISQDMLTAAADIAYGDIQSCDIGRFNGRYYNYVAAFGAFTEVSYATKQSYKNLLGHQAYVIEGLKSIPFIRPCHMTIEVNGNIITGEFIYGMITNTLSVGGFRNIAGRNVKLDDGLFECTFVRKIENVADINNVITAIINKDGNNPSIFHAKTDKIVITSDESIPWVLDGEYGGEHNMVEINIVPNAIRFLVPKHEKEEKI